MLGACTWAHATPKLSRSRFSVLSPTSWCAGHCASSPGQPHGGVGRGLCFLTPCSQLRPTVSAVGHKRTKQERLGNPYCGKKVTDLHVSHPLQASAQSTRPLTVARRRLNAGSGHRSPGGRQTGFVAIRSLAAAATIRQRFRKADTVLLCHADAFGLLANIDRRRMPRDHAPSVSEGILARASAGGREPDSEQRF